MTNYREASAGRHKHLRKMRPDWRRIQQTLGQVGKSVDSLLSRSVTIDRHMEEYEDIVQGHDRALSVLSSSSLVNFFVSAFVLLIAIGGATINFSLIARPMAEMVGGTSLIGGYRTAEIAALVAEQGLFFLDAPIKRVCVPDTPIPFAPAMETAVIPQEENIIAAIRETVNK